MWHSLGTIQSGLLHHHASPQVATQNVDPVCKAALEAIGVPVGRPGWAKAVRQSYGRLATFLPAAGGQQTSSSTLICQREVTHSVSPCSSNLA